MAPGVLLWLSLCVLPVLFSAPVESCRPIPHSIKAKVPVVVKPGYVIGKVPISPCHLEGLRLHSSDPDFAVQTDGTIVTVHVTKMTEEGKSFRVRARGIGGHHWRMDVHLSSELEQVHAHVPMRVPSQVAVQNGLKPGVLRRTKRRWSPPPFSIMENDPGPYPKDVEVVGSDSSLNYSVYYEISGQGVTLPPQNVFSVSVVDWRSCMLRVHKPVDREEYPKLVFLARVFDKTTGKETDLPLDITVVVEDVNDNAPTFSGPMDFSVTEQSNPDTKVGLVVASDLDEPDTPHTQIRFSLLGAQTFFSIDPRSGMIRTQSRDLDREVQAVHTITVEIRDMDGAKNGLFNTATATVTLLDINDNPPTFRETTYKARIEENRANVLVLRIPVDDKDEVNTKNWNAKFTITEGNQNGDFRIDTDPKTNEGLLYVSKPLDYEKGKAVKLMVTAQNEAPLVGTSGSWLSVPVELSVGDEDEGPEFTPPNMVLRVKENTPNGTVLGTYTALDPETKSSKGMRYFSVSDPGSWVSIGQSTGELKVANTIDLESPLVTNARYVITVKAVDQSDKSGIGTVTLLIEDMNDNVPVITPEGELVLCEEEEGRRGSVTIEAEDADLSPYSSPFNFELAEGHDGKWSLRDIKNTSAVLEQAVDMARGVYSVPVRVTDLQDKGAVQVVQVRVCHCLGGQCVARRSSVNLGAWGALAMILALLVLLLLCLLFVFTCTTKGEKIYMDDSSGGMLLKSNTEAPGEEVKSPNLLIVPSTGLTVDSVDATLDKSAAGGGLTDWQRTASPVGQHLTGQHLIGQQMSQENIYQTSMGRRDFMTGHGQSSFYSSGMYGGGVYTDAAFLKQSQLSSLHTWQTNGHYLEKKLVYFGGEAEERYADDLLKAYGYEGEGSPAGSVGCCSDLGDQDNLDFLDSLGSKFKTLANVCMETEED